MTRLPGRPFGIGSSLREALGHTGRWATHGGYQRWKNDPPPTARRPPAAVGSAINGIIFEKFPHPARFELTAEGAQ